MKKLNKIVSTLGPLGYMKAPGTMGSVASMPIVYLFSLINPITHLIIILFLSLASLIIISKAKKYFQERDPQEIILDEFIGCLITFWKVPLTFKSMIIGFIIFRTLDISKIFGINHAEKLKGAWGILMDDVFSGIISNIILIICLF